jgi:hypothetical protein
MIRPAVFFAVVVLSFAAETAVSSPAEDQGQRRVLIVTDESDRMRPLAASDGWIKAAGEGHVIYIQPGLFVEELTDPDNILNRLILNAITWNPG